MGILGAAGPTVELVGNVSFPVYAVKCLGSRFMLVAGGGGMAKTGVANMLEAFLMTYRFGKEHKEAEVNHLRLVQVRDGWEGEGKVTLYGWARLGRMSVLWTLNP